MTIAGSSFIHSAKQQVSSANKMIAMMRAAGQGRAGGLMTGHNSSISAGNLRATILNWRDAHPAVDLDGKEADRSTLLAGLDAGEVDIAILMGEQRVPARTILERTHACGAAVRPSFDYSGDRSLDDLREEHILLTEASRH